MVIDRIIAAVSPTWALKREVNRQKLQRVFDAAQASQYFKRRTDTRSPDAVMDNSRERLRTITRHLDENHDLAIGILDAMTNNVVGVGVVVEPMVRKRNDSLNEKLNDLIREQWEKWIEVPEVTCEIPWNELQRLVFRSWMRDGEQLIRHLEGKGYGDYNYQLQPFECDFLPYELNRDSPTITHGVEKDSRGKPTAYHLYTEHPGNTYANVGAFTTLAQETVRLPADQMSHIKFVRRIGQTRGQPLLHGVIRRLESINEYEQSEQIAARVAAEFTAFIQKPADFTGATNLGADGDRAMEMQAGAIFDLAPGETVGSLDAKRPNPELGNFRNSMLRAAAAGTGTTFSQISRDYRDSNYSSQRQELIEAYTSYKRLQDLFVAVFIKPVYRRFIRALAVSDKIALSRFGVMDLDAASAADYQGPVLPWIDPVKEAKSWELLVANQFASRDEIIRMRGRNPRIVRKQIEQEAAQMELALDEQKPEDQNDGDDQQPNQSAAG